MSIVPPKPPPEIPPAEVEERFRRLEAAWWKDIRFSSSSSEIRELC